MIYTGNSAYCYSNSLHICLHTAGMTELPDVGTIECLTGMPFGTTYLNFEVPLFFPSPAKTDPHIGLEQALASLGWACEIWSGDDAAESETALREAIFGGPVLLGPVDMSYLRYDPNHAHKSGGDHFVVIINIENGMVEIHDPQFYPFATIPMTELMASWNAKEIGYSQQAYTFRHRFHPQHAVSQSQILDNAFRVAREMQSDDREGPVVFAGGAAFRQVSKQLEPTPLPSLASSLCYFALPIGARRNHDAMHLMAQLQRDELAQLYKEKARLFGQAQYYAVTGRWPIVADIFTKLANIEEQLSEAIQR